MDSGPHHLYQGSDIGTATVPKIEELNFALTHLLGYQRSRLKSYNALRALGMPRQPLRQLNEIK